MMWWWLQEKPRRETRTGDGYGSYSTSTVETPSENPWSPGTVVRSLTRIQSTRMPCVPVDPLPLAQAGRSWMLDYA